MDCETLGRLNTAVTIRIYMCPTQFGGLVYRVTFFYTTHWHIAHWGVPQKKNYTHIMNVSKVQLMYCLGSDGSMV